jgi:hypothetical protein
MQQFLYYGGLENADYKSHPIIKQAGRGFEERWAERVRPGAFKLQPWTRRSDDPLLRTKMMLEAAKKQIGGKRRRKKRQRGGRIPLSAPKAKASAPAKKPGLWERAKGFVKDNKLISRGLTELASLAGKYKNFEKYQPYLQSAQVLAQMKGYGKKKRGKK